MKERPILFSGEMVTAILEDRKTQTRRVVKPQPEVLYPFALVRQNGTGWIVEKWPRQEREFGNFGRVERVVCPYGQPGDRLWVRETWACFGGDEYTYQKDRLAVSYRATWDTDRATDFPRASLGYIPGDRWRPSIYMPRWASRITLEITKVRVERVQDITNEDAYAEGCDFRLANTPNHANAFAILWDNINAKRRFGWDENPWVWVIEFRRRSA